MTPVPVDSLERLGQAWALDAPTERKRMLIIVNPYATTVSVRLKNLVEQLLGVPLPVRIRAWDGSQAGPPDAPALVVRNRRAVRRLLWKPGELGLARAWVAGDLEIEADK